MPKTPKLKMPKMTKSMMNGLLMIGALLLILFLVNRYGKGKLTNTEKMSGSGRQAARKNFYKQASGGNAAAVQPAQEGDNEQYAKVNSNGSQSASQGQGLPPSCSSQPTASPSELLPNDSNSEWAKLNPSGAGDLQNVNLLSAGSLIGIDTVGNTLRNANLQVRSEPANPQLNVGPWNNTTIAPDTMRVPLEIGQGPQ
jgi:hypothetical protein